MSSAAVLTAPVILRTAADDDRSIRRPRREKNRWTRTLSSVLITLALAFGFTAGGGLSPQPGVSAANAWDVFNPCMNPSPDVRPPAQPWPGLLSMMSPATAVNALAAATPNKTNYDADGKITTSSSFLYGDSYNATAYEWYGTSGTGMLYNGTWDTLGGCALINGFQGIAGSIIHGFNTTLAEIGLLFTGWAMNPTILPDLLLSDNPPGPVATLITSLQNGLYTNYLTPFIMFGMIWLAWRGLVKRRQREAIQGIIWIISAGIAASLFFIAPTATARWVDRGVSEVGALIVETGVSTVNGTDMCALPSGSDSQATREVQCALWMTFVYQPWASAQFGDVAQKNIVVPGVKSTFRASDQTGLVPLMLDVQSYNHDAVLSGKFNDAEKDKQWAAIVDTVQNNAEVASGYPNFTGNNYQGRMSIAVVNLVGMIVSAIPTVFLALGLIYQQLVFIFLLMLAPIFLLIGIHPGFGRRVALGWVEMLIGTAIKRIITYLMFTVLLALIGAITASAQTNVILAIVLMAAASFGILSYRKKFESQFGTINLGGQKFDTGEGKGLLKQAGSILAGAVGGAVGQHLSEDPKENALKGAVKGGWAGRKGGVSPVKTALGVTQQIRNRNSDPLAAALAQQDNELRREDATMNSGGTTAQQWQSWSNQLGGRSVPRPNDAALEAQLREMNVPLRDQVGSNTTIVYEDGTTATYEQARAAAAEREAAVAATLRRETAEDDRMDQGRVSATGWAQWSERTGRPVPRPTDQALADELSAMGVQFRERAGRINSSSPAASAIQDSADDASAALNTVFGEQAAPNPYARLNAIRQNQAAADQQTSSGKPSRPRNSRDAGSGDQSGS